MTKELLMQAKDALEDVLHNCDESHNTLAAFNAIQSAIAQPVPEVNKISNETWADFYIWQSGKRVHASDCATSCAPTYMPGPCDCNV